MEDRLRTSSTFWSTSTTGRRARSSPSAHLTASSTLVRGDPESPAAFRRRLLLDAAYQLTRGTGDHRRLGGVLLAEAFTRVQRAYIAPSCFAGDFGPTRQRHPFHPRRPPGSGQREEADDGPQPACRARQLAAERDRAARRSTTQHWTNRSVSLPTDSFAEESPSIRRYRRLVFTKEMVGRDRRPRFVEATDTSLPALRERLGRAGWEFATLVSDVARRDAWDTAFVDATCDPPVSFTFGAAVAHVLTRDSYRRQVVAAALRERGIDVAADPIAWERKGD
jgi:hypothetical protein